MQKRHAGEMEAMTLRHKTKMKTERSRHATAMEAVREKHEQEIHELAKNFGVKVFKRGGETLCAAFVGVGDHPDAAEFYEPNKGLFKATRDIPGSDLYGLKFSYMGHTVCIDESSVKGVMIVEPTGISSVRIRSVARR